VRHGASTSSASTSGRTPVREPDGGSDQDVTPSASPATTRRPSAQSPFLASCQSQWTRAYRPSLGTKTNATGEPPLGSRAKISSSSGSARDDGGSVMRPAPTAGSPRARRDSRGHADNRIASARDRPETPRRHPALRAVPRAVPAGRDRAGTGQVGVEGVRRVHLDSVPPERLFTARHTAGLTVINTRRGEAGQYRRGATRPRSCLDPSGSA
jgi:hypothetical protein